MDLTDEELADHARGGDHKSFAVLVSRHQLRMYGLAIHMLRNPEDAEDVAQEAFLRCYAALDTYASGHSFGAWLYRIAYNHCLDILRRRRTGPGQPVFPDQAERALLQAPDANPSVEEAALRNVSIEHMERALESLSDGHRHVLILRYTLNLSYSEMAHVLRASESAITMRLHHAKRALRAQMSAMGEDVYGAS